MAKVNLDTASRLDITCRKGDTFTLVIDFGEAISTTNSNYAMQFAETDTAAAAYTFTASNFSVTSGDATDSQLTISVTAGDTAGWTAGNYVYDLEENDLGVVKTRLYGTFVINEDVS
jgi:hypothetical protein